MSNNKNCKHCGSHAKLVKAHVIPEAFYRAIKTNNKPLYTISGTDGDFPKRSQIGIYDTGILCYNCEQIFQKCDYYAQELFLKTKYEEENIAIGSLLMYKDYNYDLLKRFFLSVTYRACLSKNSMFSNIKLDRIAITIKKILSSSNPIDAYELPCIVFHHRGEYSHIILEPYICHADGVDFYKFFLGHFGFFLNINNTMLPKHFNQYIIQPSKPLRVLSIPFENSADYESIFRIYSSNRKNTTSK